MLTDIIIKNLKTEEKAYKKNDSNGLYIYVSPKGKKVFRFDYSYLGKRKTATLGSYPALTLLNARKIQAEYKVKLENGIDPLAEKAEIKQAEKDLLENTFYNVSQLWLEKRLHANAPLYIRKTISLLNHHIYPTFANRGIKTITSKEVLDCVRKIEARGHYETAKKTFGICNRVFAFAVGEGLLDINTSYGLSGQLQSVRNEHFAHITDRKILGKLLLDIDEYPHGVLIKIALQIAPLVFLRPSELMNAEWSEIDFEESIWIIPEHRMKARKKHMLPLSKQVQAYLEQLHKITGDTKFLFANWNNRNKPITSDGLRQGLRRMGYDKDVITPHGFRHTASTFLNEMEYNADHIEKQLAHTTGYTVRGIYNHAQYLGERRKMMQEWSDFCDKLKEKAEKENKI